MNHPYSTITFRDSLCIFYFIFFCCWMRISRALFSHIFHYVITHLEFDSRFSQFLFRSVLFRFVTRILFYFFVSVSSCMLCVVSVEILWRPILQKKKKWLKTKYKSHDKYWLNETKMLVELFQARKNICFLSFFFLFFVYGLSNRQKWSIFFTIFGLNYWILC